MTERQPTEPATPATGPSPSDPRPAFAHASEAELSRILDFYEVRWEYEPHVFPILWTLDGAVAESFAPDFFLPDLDLYVELTTLRQPLVRKKNRKLRRLRELYPDVRIKLFYARDFRALMLKYGKVGLADGLSGSLGQMVPAAVPSTAGMASTDSAGPDPLVSAVPGFETLPPGPTHAAASSLASAPPSAAATTRSAASRRNARRSRRRHATSASTGEEVASTAVAARGAGFIAETMQ